MKCHGAVFRSWLVARLFSVLPERPSVMPGLVPRLSGLDFAERAHGLDSTGFERVPSDRDTDQRPASQPTPRHARACSGHPCGRAAEAVEGDARNKSGHDGGRAFRHGGKRRGQEPLRASKTPARLHPTAEPDSSGTSPGMTGIRHESQVEAVGISGPARPAPPPGRGGVGCGHLVSFRSGRAGRGGASLFRAYRARARARLCAGAVRAPDCARETARRTSPVGSAGVFSDPGEAAPDAPSLY